MSGRHSFAYFSVAVDRKVSRLEGERECTKTFIIKKKVLCLDEFAILAKQNEHVPAASAAQNLTKTNNPKKIKKLCGADKDVF